MATSPKQRRGRLWRRGAMRSSRPSSLPRIATTGSSSGPERFHATTPLAEATITPKIHGRSGHGGGKPIASNQSGSGEVRPKGKRSSFCRCQWIRVLTDPLVQPVLFLQLAGQVGLGEIAEVLVGERVELVLEPARQHALYLLLPGLLLEPAVLHQLLCPPAVLFVSLDDLLPGLLLEPAVLHQLLGPPDVLVVELDAHVAGQAVAIRIRAREADELGLGNRHALALEGEVDRALLHHRGDVVAPGVVVDQDVDRDLVLLVEAPGQAAHPARGLAVAGQQHAVVAAPELVL